MGQIGPGGPFQQPFKPTSQSPQSNPVTPGGEASGAAEIFQNPAASQAAIRMLGELLLAPLAAYQTQMDSSQLSQFLKNLLQLPREFEDLLSMLATNSQDAKTLALLKTLLADNPNLAISLEDLQKLIQQSSKLAEGKLVKLLQSAQMNHTASSQDMGEMISMLSQLSTRVSASPVEALNTTLLLYLPWYPLAANQKLNLHFEQSGQGDEDDQGSKQNDEAHLVLLVETNALGRFKSVVGVVQPTRLLFHISHDPQATAHQKSIEAKLNTALTKAGMSAPEVVFQERTVSPKVFMNTGGDTSSRKEGDSNNQSTQSVSALSGQTGDASSQEKQASDKQAIIVHSIGQVPVAVVQGAYWLARIIFEQDNQLSLHQTRAEQLPE